MRNSNKIVFIFVALFLLGCQKDKEDITVYMDTVKATKQAKIAPVPPVKPYKKFIYSASKEDLRNPFIKTVIDSPLEIEKEKVNNGIQPDSSRLKEALESYGLQDLQLVGTLKKERLWALIRAPEGVIHRVKVGDYMGLNEGEVLTISDEEVTLKEIVSNGDSGYLEREASLSLIDVN